ncbi:hypothetical protein [Vibrio mytili]|uniref:Uncharacterized protein n=1 Tax=Vibrio mytili TaxID=50718 RepID=A0A0C3EAV4_9VIBR|nr:hypothetical protein [Vibrio mytili]KIN11568.1 hypothetical protein SU60_07140 [Vibrio mytili]
MNPVGSSAVNVYNSQPTKVVTTKTSSGEVSANSIQTPQSKVSLSNEGKALLAALQQIDQESQAEAPKAKTVGDKVESFAHGALGIDSPEKIKEEDDSYSAGQYVSAALSVGGFLLALL